MDIKYKITNCPHCKSNDFAILGDDSHCYGLVSIEKNNIANFNSFLPVIAIICRNCGHVEFVHINSKKINNE